MALYTLQDATISALKRTTFQSEGVLERQNLQAALRDNIEIISPDTLIISEEFSEWDFGSRRIDLLGLDKQANLVVIELKRDETGAHMELQALRYAAMASTMTFKAAVATFQQYLNSRQVEKKAEVEILRFLNWNDSMEHEFPTDVRIVLASANFSRELTTSVMWLNDRNLDIRCVRIQPYKEGVNLLLDIEQIIPLPEAEDYQIRIREQSNERRAVALSNRDQTRYEFQGVLYNKRKLVLAIVQQYLILNSHTTLQELKEIFPESLHSNHSFIELKDKAQQIFDNTGHKRHFLNENEILQTIDGFQIAICNQWGIHNMDGILKVALALGYQINKV
jgi:hypothetical protein